MEDYNFYSENIATLVRNRAEILKDPKQYFTQLPFRVQYFLSIGRGSSKDICLVKGPLFLGTLIRAWESLPEYFIRNRDGKDYLVYWFNGSPLSGRCEYSGVNLETGERICGEPGTAFHRQCEAIEELRDEDDEALRERLMEEPDFEPLSMTELINYWKFQENLPDD